MHLAPSAGIQSLVLLQLGAWFEGRYTCPLENLRSITSPTERGKVRVEGVLDESRQCQDSLPEEARIGGKEAFAELIPGSSGPLVRRAVHWSRIYYFMGDLESEQELSYDSFRAWSVNGIFLWTDENGIMNESGDMMRGRYERQTARDKFSSMELARYKKCSDTLCDVIWEDGEPVWKRSFTKANPAYICFNCKERLDNEDEI